MLQPCWRLMPEIIASGATHMAIDAWVLDQLIHQQHEPTLRFYRWQPAAISLGYHQKRWPEHWQTLHWQEKPLDLVRRPTGGRAVLHQGDFTYAITLPMLSDRRQDLYRHICDALIAAWQRLGVPLRYGTAGRGYRHEPNCFATATTADLVTDAGYKLIGSAQLRRERSLLQHGSMRLWPDRALHRQVFGEAVSEAGPPTVIPEQPSDEWLQQLVELIAAAIQQSLGVTFNPKPLTVTEQQAAFDAYGQQASP